MPFTHHLKSFHIVAGSVLLVVMGVFCTRMQLRTNQLEVAANRWVPAVARVHEEEIRYRQGTISCRPTVSYFYDGTAFESKSAHWIEVSNWRRVYRLNERRVTIAINPDSPREYDIVSADIIEYHRRKRNEGLVFVIAILGAMLGTEIARRYRRADSEEKTS